ncbi:MAG TPA: Flp family type IVb pilin [Devosiaceae bacterium]|jgi:pilus assembly protein Flp/PilA|nr:Flp family type IVb pilin [Devosiaceae bacterium]
MNTVARFLKDESGATAIEYGLIAALIAVGIIAAATMLGDNLETLFRGIGTRLGQEATRTDDTI